MLIEEGLLWYDNDPKADLAEKIRRAVTRYREKYGRPANVCYVNPVTLSGRPAPDGSFDLPLGNGVSVRVVQVRNVLPHHFWVGISTKQETSSRALGARNAASRGRR